MLELYLLRHGKAEWLSQDGSDKNRRISKTGILHNHAVGSFISEHQIKIDKLLCSSAKRTQQTKDIIINYFKYKPEIEILDSIYKNKASTLVNIIKTQQSDNSKLLIIGHQPSLSEVIELLSIDKNNQFFKQATWSFGTSSLFKFSFNEKNWQNIDMYNSNIEFFINANELNIF